MWRPMAYFYQTDKFQENYEEVFSALSGYMHMNDLQFKESFKMMADWEVAERQAFRMSFDISLLGCLFHLGLYYLTGQDGLF